MHDIVSAYPYLFGFFFGIACFVTPRTTTAVVAVLIARHLGAL